MARLPKTAIKRARKTPQAPEAGGYPAYKLPRPDKAKTRTFMAAAVARAVEEKRVQEAVVLDGPGLGYTRALLDHQVEVKISAVERCRFRANLMCQTAKQRLGISSEQFRVYNSDIETYCKEIHPSRGNSCAFLLDVYSEIKLADLKDMLSSRPPLVTITSPGRSGVKNNTQTRRTAELHKQLKALGYELRIAMGYAGEPDPFQPDKTGMPMMYYEARLLQAGEVAEEPKYFPNEVRPVTVGGSISHCRVTWHGFGEKEVSQEPPEFYWEHINSAELL